MKEESAATTSHNLLAVSQNVIESYDSTIVFRSNRNQALSFICRVLLRMRTMQASASEGY